MRTIAVMNEKGRSGKTATTISLAAVLAEGRLRTLVVDLDPQASPSLWLGRKREPALYSRSRRIAIWGHSCVRQQWRVIDPIAAGRELGAAAVSRIGHPASPHDGLVEVLAIEDEELSELLAGFGKDPSVTSVWPVRTRTLVAIVGTCRPVPELITPASATSRLKASQA